METTRKEPRGIRNNNPLNIRFKKYNQWVGKINEDKQDHDFEEFKSMKWGLRAAFVLIHNYITLWGLKTLADIIKRWAPADDGNNPMGYTNTVASRVGIDPKQELDFTDGVIMGGIVQEMARVETGRYLELPIVLCGYCLACHSLGIQPRFTIEFWQRQYKMVEQLEIKCGNLTGDKLWLSK